jgi:hypothetical protein
MHSFIDGNSGVGPERTCAHFCMHTWLHNARDGVELRTFAATPSAAAMAIPPSARNIDCSLMPKTKDLLRFQLMKGEDGCGNQNLPAWSEDGAASIPVGRRLVALFAIKIEYRLSFS